MTPEAGILDRREQEALFSRLTDPGYLPTVAECARGLEAGLFLRFVEKMGYYELYTQEYLAGLASYLQPWIDAAARRSGKQATVLEVGAGNGRLAHFLEALVRGRVIATDNGDYEEIRPCFPVVKMGYAEAISYFDPQIIICSWMPYQKDWTGAFRTPETQLYVLIGDPLRCGDGLGTYGVDGITGRVEVSYGGEMPKRDGFKMRLLPFGQYQYCTFDGEGRNNNFRYSRTLAFEREGCDKLGILRRIYG